MKDNIKLPPIQAIIDLHAELLEAHGGAPGLRDRAALEACLARPLQIIAYSEADVTIFDIAAALCVSICRNHHPFIDGNKRVAFVALGLTLNLNGLYLDIQERAAAETILAVAAGTMTEDDFKTWVAENSYELPELRLSLIG